MAKNIFFSMKYPNFEWNQSVASVKLIKLRKIGSVNCEERLMKKAEKYITSNMSLLKISIFTTIELLI